MNQSAIIIALSEMPLLKNLTPGQLSLLAENAVFVKIPKNGTIYEIGSKQEYVYLVEKGSVKLAVLATCGKTLTKEIVYDNEIFGENIFSNLLITKEFAEAMTETKLYKININAFRSILIENHLFAAQIMNVILTKLQKLEDRLKNFVFRKAKERIVDFIYRTGLNRGVKIGIKECLIDHGMSHKEIAYLTDTSRQTVARILNELKKENYIHYGSRKSNKILIRDMEIMQQYKWVG